MSGCSTVPATQIKFNPITKTLVIRSPKDVEIRNLTAGLDEKERTTIRFESYVSKNNAAVIEAIARQNQATLNALSVSSGVVLGEILNHAK